MNHEMVWPMTAALDWSCDMEMSLVILALQSGKVRQDHKVVRAEA